jgi:hypothetical protein
MRSAGVPAALAPILLLASLSGARAEILLHPEGWKFPNLHTASKEAIRVSDKTPLIPGKETTRRGYRKPDGTYFQTYEIEGRIFGVEFDDNGKPPFEYSIMDTDGDGRFESKIVHGKDNKDRAYVPQWVIDYYYGLHPELENPTAKQRVAGSGTPPSEPAGEGGDPDAAPPPEVRDRPNP